MAATFDYEKRLDDLRIRLLRIHAGGPTEPIKCDILEHELDGSVDYTAISYVWGDNASRLAITCNEQKLYVTENLHGVLMRYRKHGHTGLLWADAICVNQGDKAEKTEQVKTMKTIHELARMVVVWLGEELVSDREGIRLARKLYDALRDQRIKNVVDYSQIDHEGWGIPRADAPSWRSLRTLLGRTWFQRVWVVQEFICAKACTMWCGEIEIQPEVLMVSACLLSKHQNLAMIVAALSNDSTTHYTTRVNEIASFWLLKETIGQSKDQGLKLMGLLWLTLAFRATDPRDKVFALVGLAYGVRSDFVDYTLSTRDVFIRTAKFVIRNNPTNALQLLSFVGQDRPDHLPSWVPDWIPSRQGLSPLTGRYYNSIPPPPLLKSAAEIQFLGGDVSVLVLMRPDTSHADIDVGNSC